jgi:hypothetical protein
MPPRARRLATLWAAALALQAASTVLASPSWGWGAGRLPWGGDGGDDAGACFEDDCRASPFIMHPSRRGNATGGGTVSCFKFVAIGCYAAPKGCCPAVARRLSALEFAISERRARARARGASGAAAAAAGCFAFAWRRARTHVLIHD